MRQRRFHFLWGLSWQGVPKNWLPLSGLDVNIHSGCPQHPWPGNSQLRPPLPPACDSRLPTQQCEESPFEGIPLVSPSSHCPGPATPPPPPHSGNESCGIVQSASLGVKGYYNFCCDLMIFHHFCYLPAPNCTLYWTYFWHLYWTDVNVKLCQFMCPIEIQ